MPYLLYYRFIKGYAEYSPRKISNSNLSTRVSLVICTLNAEEKIEAKLRDLLRQNYPLNEMDVIVVDGGSTDGTVQKATRLKDELKDELRVEVIAGKHFPSKASQINKGISLADGEIVITTDADVFLHPDSIRALVDSLSVSGIGAACSKQILTDPDRNFITRTEAAYRGPYTVLRLGESNLHSTPIFHGGLSGYRKEALSPIDEDVNADDTRLALGAIRKGFRAIYSSSSLFYVEVAASLSDAWRQRVRRGQGIQRHFWRNRDLASRRFGKFAFPIFTANFFMHLISPILFVAASACFVIFLATFAFRFPTVVVFGIIGVLLASFILRQTRVVITFISFILYQAALFWAMVLHLVGHDYARWSRTTRM